MTEELDQEVEQGRPCPACPDGNRWTSEGPVGRCPVCKGFGYIEPREREDD